MNIYHKYHVDKMTEREVYITLGEVLTKLEQITALTLRAKADFCHVPTDSILYVLGMYEEADRETPFRWPNFDPVKDLGLESIEDLKGGECK